MSYAMRCGPGSEISKADRGQICQITECIRIDHAGPAHIGKMGNGPHHQAAKEHGPGRAVSLILVERRLIHRIARNTSALS